jgi:voltage-gated potassium channel Kch
MPYPLSNQSDRPRAIIAGYGIPGRAALEMLLERGYECAIIELNGATVQRMVACGLSHATFLEGDATQDEVLKRAGIEGVSIIVVAVPVDAVSVEITRRARALNPQAQIITRCQYTSAGLEARQLGANDVVIAEQTVAVALRGLLERVVG